MDKNRNAAYLTLMDVESKKAYSNIALNNHIVRIKPDAPAFVRQLVFGVLENKMLLDYFIDHLVPSGSEKVRTSDLVILRMGIYQLGFMSSVPEHAAVNESVKLAKKYCGGREGFVNATLRSYLKIRFEIELPKREDDIVRFLSIRYSYEPWIVELWLKHYDVEFTEQLLRAGDEIPDLVLRANGLRISRDDLFSRLESIGYTVAKGKLCDDAVYVKTGRGYLTDTKLYQDGMFSIQDESSMLVATLLDPKPGDLVMDMCAAPGGKALAIAERMHNSGEIIASDIYIRKLALVNREAERLGVNIIRTRMWDAAKIDSSLAEKADCVLVDAPCSGLGVVRRKPEIKYKKKDAELDSLPQKQLEILTASSKYVKPGGTLVYSTCTINPPENQRVVVDFLKSNPSFKKEEQTQLLPNVDGTDGFFMCKMTKVR